MPSFQKGPNFRTPFGKNVFLRSTSNFKTESRFAAAASVTSETIDTFTGQKVLQTGQLMAKITSGGDSGKVGPYQGGTPVNEVQNVSVAGGTAGTWFLRFNGERTADLAFNCNAAAVQAALQALENVGANNLTVTGGPANTTAFVLTFVGTLANTNVAQVTVDVTGISAGAPAGTNTTTTAGGPTAPATDGRGDINNVVGLNNTFLPWQLMEHDEAIAVVYDASVVQANCFEYDAAGARIALSDATAAALRSVKGLKLIFK